MNIYLSFLCDSHDILDALRGAESIKIGSSSKFQYLITSDIMMLQKAH